MLNCCKVCTKVRNVEYKEGVKICGKCKECNKYDMTDYAVEKPKKDPFEDNRWLGGKQSMIPKETKYMIKKLYATGHYTQSQLAKLYSITQAMVSIILKEMK